MSAIDFSFGRGAARLLRWPTTARQGLLAHKPRRPPFPLSPTSFARASGTADHAICFDLSACYVPLLG
jgi:hypothetical protein